MNMHSFLKAETYRVQQCTASTQQGAWQTIDACEIVIEGKNQSQNGHIL